MEIKIFEFSPFAENTYIIWDEQTGETAVIDPGCVDQNEEEQLANFISENNLTVKYLINTHCHIDHIFGNAFVKDKFNPIFLAPEKDVFLLEKALEQAKSFGVKIKPSPMPDEFNEESRPITLGDLTLEFLFTPGHTPGEYCVNIPSEKKCFTGDVLFYEGIGRTDLWGGDLTTLIDSIKNKLFTLPDDTEIFPGHGISSTIKHEKENNPFLI